MCNNKHGKNMQMSPLNNKLIKFIFNGISKKTRSAHIVKHKHYLWDSESCAAIIESQQ